jgi:predicted TIM-barrel fold metal-dependent hydrolase
VDLSDLPIVDDHGHPFLTDPWTVSHETFLQIFTEGRPGSMLGHLVHGGYYQRALHGMAGEFRTQADLSTLLEARRRLGPASVRDMIAARRIETLLIDTGYPPTAMSLETMRTLVPCDIREIVRIETLAQGLLASAGSYESFVEAYRAALSAAAGRAVSLKSVIAYRSGLAVRAWSEADARASHRQVAERVAAGGSPRLTEKPLLDTLFLIALEVAIEAGRPMQVHAGWGDTDVDLPQANPVLLRPIVEDPRWADARIVVLHQAYPYFREAAFMAAVWPQVFLDLSLAIPYLGPGAVFPLVEILSLAPHSKLLYGSDVQGLPELFALSADWGRAALGEALEWIDSRGGLPGGDARAVARRILSDNARDLYRL